mmetsp:Transcript_25915/g.59871  ORF Transcript_25915/g.59871 Transcript_25915/m.59871 type:complete len:568 (+) Transcript_25915:101-1804(+)
MANSSDESNSGGEEESTMQYPRAAKLRMDPLDVRFSQTRIRHVFRDRKRVTDAVASISVKPCTAEETKTFGSRWRLHAPFPDMEVIRWRCKLRDEKSGEAKLDPASGKEMFDSEERWFTLDNRRLYCLQEAAVRLWPERCLVEVAEVRGGTHIGLPELKKFRTFDLGRSILIGSRSDAMPNARWSWQDEVKQPNPSKSSVFAHIVKHDGAKNTHAEVSKKLSWILRRGAAAMNLHMDIEGWVKVNDLLKLSIFNGLGQQQFFAVIQAANTEKPRYEIKGVGPGQPGVMIRASRTGSSQRLPEAVGLDAIESSQRPADSLSPMKVALPGAVPPALSQQRPQATSSSSSKGKQQQQQQGGKKGRAQPKPQALPSATEQVVRNHLQVVQMVQQMQARQAAQARMEMLQTQLQIAQQMQAQQQQEQAMAALLESAQFGEAVEERTYGYDGLDYSASSSRLDFEQPWRAGISAEYEGMGWDDIAWAQSEAEERAKEAKDLTQEDIAARVAQVHKAAMARHPVATGHAVNSMGGFVQARARNTGQARTAGEDLEARITEVLAEARNRSQGISI